MGGKDEDGRVSGMRLSMKSDYALRVLFTLVEERGRGPVPIRELAEQNDVPKRFLEHIMLDLKRQGWVRSLPGSKGGYILDRHPESISMGQVVRLFDGVLAPIGCVSISQYEPCSQQHRCRFRRILLNIRNEVARRMDGASLAEVFAGAPVRQEEVFSSDFMDGGGI